jgi:transposase
VSTLTRRVSCSSNGSLGEASSACKADKEIEENYVNLMTVPGIGPIISPAMVATIGEGESFDRGRYFAAWVGLVPRQYSTGGRTVRGRISKRGSRYLRMLFVQAAKIIMMRLHRWPNFSFGDWPAKVSERMHRNKTTVALANKHARMARSILRHRTVFDAPRDEVAIGV